MAINEALRAGAPILDSMREQTRASIRVLLHACRLALVRLDDGTEASAVVARHVRAAIAKAEGHV